MSPAKLSQLPGDALKGIYGVAGYAFVVLESRLENTLTFQTVCLISDVFTFTHELDARPVSNIVIELT